MTYKSRPLSPHETLMLACATPFSDERTRQAVSAAASMPGLDWPTAARMGMSHGVAQSMDAHLRESGVAPLMPAPVRTCFERMFTANALRNQVMFREAARLQRALTAAGIECLILKGVALALTVYPDPAWRNFADIDLLVTSQNYDAACEVAEACGFRCTFPEKDPYCIHQPYVLSCPEDILTQTLPLEFDPDTPRTMVADYCHTVLIEIHRGLFHDVNGIARETATEMLWQGARTAYFPDGTPFSGPSTEVMLFHLAAHAADHGFGRLMFFMDIAATVRHGGDKIDWDRVVRLAIENDVTVHVYHSLELAHRAFGIAMPPEVLEALAGPQGHKAARVPLALPDVLSAPLKNKKSRFIQQLRLSHNGYQFCISLLSTIAPPPLVMRRIYGVRHPLLIALYYVLRPFLLSGHLLSHLMHSLWYRAAPRKRSRDLDLTN